MIEIERLACGCEPLCTNSEMCDAALDIWRHWYEDFKRHNHLPLDNDKRLPRTYRLSSAAWNLHYEVSR